MHHIVPTKSRMDAWVVVVHMHSHWELRRWDVVEVIE